MASKLLLTPLLHSSPFYLLTIGLLFRDHDLLLWLTTSRPNTGKSPLYGDPLSTVCVLSEELALGQGRDTSLPKEAIRYDDACWHKRNRRSDGTDLSGDRVQHSPAHCQARS
ncbi:hypothetical protein NDA11_003631 [Ustilago hordei]|nr:hypothetical protein NDA10_001261 [Ustilago hordei]KAJ1573385.1 hypothetical protein NDA15_006546 [Ustilago hordei]KAJ1574671.1 hypothetical protein NDA12_000950 [Ustilago hordei]KAJ1576653.1 hypothetical protein NDA11_003631 [Ustilago hordei]KAJ1596217.1 hypothetical protein NDA14_001024 [Ustilago hordei]